MQLIEGVSASGHFFKDVRCFGGPDEGLGLFIVKPQIVGDGLLKLRNRVEDAALDPVLLRSRKNRSTMLSQEALVGVK